MKILKKSEIIFLIFFSSQVELKEMSFYILYFDLLYELLYEFLYFIFCYYIYSKIRVLKKVSFICLFVNYQIIIFLKHFGS